MSRSDLINLQSPEETWTEDSAALLWEKQLEAKEYSIYVNQTEAGKISSTDYTLTGLENNQTYEVYIIALMEDGEAYQSNVVSISTKSIPELFDITNYGAVGDGKILNTEAIQSAIDHCTPGGKVYVPKGVFVTGALYIKNSIGVYSGH